jgi:FKBP-type peptidyl-prolyl cis-trans isomerase FkpA
MKKLLLFVLAGTAVFCYFSCAKASPDNPPCTSNPVTADSAALIKFAGDSIALTKDSTGLYYHIIDSGSALKPIFSSNITVNYVGRLMNNIIFDSASNTNLNGAGLYNLIPGWQIGLPKIGKGGRIQLFIPSALAWGCTGYGPVPANAPVYFDVTLLQVN